MATDNIVDLPRQGVGLDGLRLLTLERLKLNAQYVIPDAVVNSAELSVVADGAARALVVKLEAFVYAKHEEEYGENINIPYNLWAAIKLTINQHFHTKLKWRYIEKRVTRHIYRMCPHGDYCETRAHTDYLRLGGSKPDPTPDKETIN